MSSISKLINDKENVKFNDIPLDWHDSFKRFMFGQTICRDDDNNDIAFYGDFIRWYYINKKELDREMKIDNVLNRENE